MKKLTPYFVYVLLSVFLFSCESNKLTQESAEKAIKDFVTSQGPMGTDDPYPFEGTKINDRGFYKADAIKDFEPLNQFNKTQATIVANFKFRSGYKDFDLSLEYGFKKNEGGQWFLDYQKPIRASGEAKFIKENINKAAQ